VSNISLSLAHASQLATTSDIVKRFWLRIMTPASSLLLSDFT